MTLICVTLKVESLLSLTKSAEVCKSLSADIIEARLDFFKGQISSSILKKIFEIKTNIGLPVIITIRPSWEGGKFQGDEDLRTKFLNESIDLGFDFIDVELKMVETKRNQLITKAKENGVKIIISHHDFSKTPSREKILDLIKQCIDAGGDIAKVVFKNNSNSDVLNILKACAIANENDYSFTAMGIGPYGHITRIIGLSLGCEIVYASLEKSQAVVEGQVDIMTLKDICKVLKY